MLTQQIAAKKLDWVDPDIKKHFKAEPIRGETKLFHFNHRITSKEAIAEMAKENYIPANISELLAYDWNGEDVVTALGSVVKVDGYRDLPGLFRDDSARCLGFSWFDGDWDTYYRFLAVKLYSVTQSLETSTLTLSNLEARVQKLESLFAKKVLK